MPITSTTSTGQSNGRPSGEPTRRPTGDQGSATVMLVAVLAAVTVVAD